MIWQKIIKIINNYQLGIYIESKELIDGAPTYTNSKDMSFFRNRNFWYLGDLG